MKLLSTIANREDRLGVTAFQFVLVVVASIGIIFLPQAYWVLIIIFPMVIGWCLNANEIHRLILIPLWIVISLIIGSAIY